MPPLELTYGDWNSDTAASNNVAIQGDTFTLAIAIPDSGLYLQLDATDTSSVTTSSGNVTDWADLSGNNRDLSGSAGSYDPAFSNGNNGVYFDFHRMDTAFSDVNYLVTFAIVVRIENPDTNGNFEGFFSSADNTSNTVLYAETPSTDNALSMAHDSNNRLSGSFNPYSNLPIEAIMTVRFVNGTNLIRFNGTEVLNQSLSTGGFVDGGVQIGDSVLGSGNDLKGTYVGEFEMWDRELSPSEIQQTESALSDKWGIPV